MSQRMRTSYCNYLHFAESAQSHAVNMDGETRVTSDLCSDTRSLPPKSKFLSDY